MIELPFSDFRHRVLTSRERVKFADADPYGHLASGRYVDMIMSHRVEALEDLLGFSIMKSAGSGVAFPARNIEVSYLRPAFVGESLEVGSWLEELGTSSFEVRAIVSGADDRKARADCQNPLRHRRFAERQNRPGAGGTPEFSELELVAGTSTHRAVPGDDHRPSCGLGDGVVVVDGLMRLG